MKTIAQRFADKVGAMPAGASPQDIRRLQPDSCFEFWTPWLIMVDPLGWGSGSSPSISLLFNSTARLRSQDEVVAAKALMKEYLRVPELRFSTYFKVRGIVEDACRKALEHNDVDIALCALMVFVQLELGAEPDPNYGCWPKPKARDLQKLDDANLPDDPISAEIELEIRYDTFEHWGTTEYHLVRWFEKWEEIIGDDAQFEQRFPGMGQRRVNLARAFGPIFTHLDPLSGWCTLELCLEWAKRLLRSPLEEHLLAAIRASVDPGSKAAEAA
jgi:hypothetical protein